MSLRVYLNHLFNHALILADRNLCDPNYWKKIEEGFSPNPIVGFKWNCFESNAPLTVRSFVEAVFIHGSVNPNFNHFINEI